MTTPTPPERSEPQVFPDPGDGLGPYCLIPLSAGKSAMCSPEDLSELLRFKWHATKSRALFYARRSDDNRRGMFMHRELMGAPRHLTVDHRNGNALDNRRGNLRLATLSQNGANRHTSIGNSRFVGIHWCRFRKRWRVAIKIDGRMKHLGYFLDESEAARRHDRAALVRYGEFAVLNFPEERESAAAEPVSLVLPPIKATRRRPSIARRA